MLGELLAIRRKMQPDKVSRQGVAESKQSSNIVKLMEGCLLLRDHEAGGPSKLSKSILHAL